MIQGMILFIRSHPQLFAEYNPKVAFKQTKKKKYRRTDSQICTIAVMMSGLVVSREMEVATSHLRVDHRSH